MRIILIIFLSHLTLKMTMKLYSNNLIIFWKRKDLWYLPKQIPKISKYYQTCSNVISTGILGVSAGVLGIECGITVGLNENAPTGESRHIRAVSPIDEVDISIVAHSELNRNNSVRYYV